MIAISIFVWSLTTFAIGVVVGFLIAFIGGE
jgi:hypothetical protein